MTKDPFELEARNIEYAIIREPGTLVIRDVLYRGWFGKTLILDGKFWHFSDINDAARIEPREIAIVVACTNQCYEGRPSTRAHYLVTPSAIGWYGDDPSHLNVIIPVPE